MSVTLRVALALSLAVHFVWLALWPRAVGIAPPAVPMVEVQIVAAPEVQPEIKPVIKAVPKMPAVVKTVPSVAPELVAPQVLIPPSAGKVEVPETTPHTTTRAASPVPDQTATQTATAKPVVQALPPSIQAAGGQTRAPEWYAVRQLDRPPQRLSRERPEYPWQAQRNGVHGSLKVRVWITALGNVERIEIIAAEPPGVFEASVQKYFASMRYQPPQREGVPVRARIEERVTFRVTDGF